MSDFAIAHLEEIEEISDGCCPWRAVRHHFGITSFGINAWTGREAGDRIINEHDEEGEDEELDFVQQGRARFELDGERVDASAGTFVFAHPGVKRTAFAEEPGTTILPVDAGPGVRAGGLGALGSVRPALPRRGATPKRLTGLGAWPRAHPEIPGAAVQPRRPREPRRP